MKRLFGRMTFPRAVILFCSAGSVVLGVLVYLRSERLAEVERQLRSIPEVVKEIQADALRLNDLKRSESSDGLKAQSEPLSYIQSVAAAGDVGVGQMSSTTDKRDVTRGVEDTIYKITPFEVSRKYPRLTIANFLYRLEEGSRRVKVTRIKLTPFEKVTPGEIGKDSWKFEASLTTRSKLDTAPAEGG